MACYFIVYHHGGRIQAGNTEGGGTLFTIHLPLEPTGTSMAAQEKYLLAKVLMTAKLWERLIAGDVIH